MAAKQLSHTIYANPSLEWYGFEPVGYRLDTDRLPKLPVQIQPPEGECRDVTFVDAWRLFTEQEILHVAAVDHVHAKVPAGTYVLSASSDFLERLLAAIIEVARRKENPWYVSWCYWGEDHVVDDLHQAFEFFVAAGDQIVVERVSFTDHRDNGFDPTYFKNPTLERRAWRNDSHWAEATVQSAYRRFYTETATGQLLLLRPDRPKLFHFEREQADMAAALASLAHDVSRIRVLLGFSLLVAVIAFVVYLFR